MARKLRLQYDGAIYHITARGNGRRRIFLEDSDRERFLWRLSESAELYEVRVYLYCLMDNHFHLLIETPRGNVSRFMQSLLTGYAVYFNLKHRTGGHLLQGRYGAQLVEGDEYLLKLSRYVHLNPVRTRKASGGLVAQRRQSLRAYQWSSYRGYVDSRSAGELVEYAPILSMMNPPKGEQRARYRSFVETGLADDEKEFEELLRECPRGIGSRDFRHWVDKEYARLRDSMGSAEDISFRRECVLQDVEGIVEVVADEFGVSCEDMTRQMRGTWARPAAAYLLCKHSGLSQRAAGKMLGYRTGSAVSRQLSRFREAVAAEKKVARRLRKLEKRVQSL